MAKRQLGLSIRGIIAAFLLVAGVATGNINGQDTASRAVLSLDDEAAKKVDALLSQWDKNDMPGGAVGVVKDGRLIYKRAFGMANLDHDVPNTTTTRFNLASVAKPFTAMSVALLAQQGKLSLDDDIRKYIPEMPKYDDTITIRHLVHHASGIRDYESLIFFGGLGNDNAHSPKTILNLLARQKGINFAPGSKYQYSNSGYFLLGIIVERVSGRSLRAFADENIFKPLGMKNTLYSDNRFEVIKNRAQGYRVGPDKRVRARSTLNDLVGDGGVLSTVQDLYLWVQNYYEPKVGNKELIQLLTTPGTFTNGEKMDYAFGVWRVEFKGLPVIEHSGNIQSGYRAKILSFPEQKFSVIALSNNAAIYPSAIVDKLTDIYLEGQVKPEASSRKPIAQTPPPAIALSEKETLRLVGTYAHAESGRFLKLGLKDGKLIETAIFRKEVPVKAASDNQLLIIESSGMTELNPVIDKSGKVAEIRILTKSGKPDVFVPVKPAFDSPQQLTEYAGTYYSEEFGTDHKISLKGNDLAIQIGDSLETRLVAAYADFFIIPDGEVNISFTRDDKGKITGFVFNAVGGRDIKGVVFKRRGDERHINENS